MAATVTSNPEWTAHTKVFSPVSYYDGQVDSSREIHGFGVYVWGDQPSCTTMPRMYAGHWKQTLMHGQGCEIDEDCIFVGQYVDDHRHGQGVVLLKDGTLFWGEFDNDAPVKTSGITTSADGTVRTDTVVSSSPDLSGDGAEDKAHTREFKNSSSYDGGLDELGREHGKGTYRWGNVQNWRGHQFGLYHGDWQHGAMHGKGVLVGKFGTYVGDFCNGEKEGQGVFFYKSGAVYFGDFEKGQPAGNGTSIESNGRVVTQVGSQQPRGDAAGASSSRPSEDAGDPADQSVDGIAASETSNNEASAAAMEPVTEADVENEEMEGDSQVEGNAPTTASPRPEADTDAASEQERGDEHTASRVPGQETAQEEEDQQDAQEDGTSQDADSHAGSELSVEPVVPSDDPEGSGEVEKKDDDTAEAMTEDTVGRSNATDDNGAKPASQGDVTERKNDEEA